MKTYAEMCFELFAITVGIGAIILIGISVTAPDSVIRHLTQMFFR